MAPSKFAAGWFYGLTGEDKRRDLRNCFAENEELTNLLYDTMAAYVEGDMELGDQKMLETKPLLQEAMAGCEDFAESMDKLNEQLKNLRESENWQEEEAKVYEENKDKIEAAVRMQLE